MTERTAGPGRRTAPERSGTGAVEKTEAAKAVEAAKASENGTDAGAARTSGGGAPARKAAPRRASRPRSTADRSGRPWLLRPRGLDPDGVRQRWIGTQGAFVDDPQESVREADALAAEVAEAVVAAIEERRSVLRAAWSDGEGTDTESLRLTLRDYRSFVKGLLGDTA
ncbi:hypothetical protein HNR06_004465 [Nocardiopsis arvandica]|uniref:Uncharacterized protein n=1 Tax=Nocardiopsis sinuspersici TaxID=501010 RepID=A0A7Y9XFK7_9ACTN|nr:hypothetical protein [Nocardiopsis sinuspersici]NYH54876.1 hypothetical protein [Nocardiopsis sinuspersici]